MSERARWIEGRYGSHYLKLAGQELMGSVSWNSTRNEPNYVARFLDYCAKFDSLDEAKVAVEHRARVVLSVALGKLGDLRSEPAGKETK